MVYARYGFDAVEPVAYGCQTTGGVTRGFLLIEELTGYSSLRELLSQTETIDKKVLNSLTDHLAETVATIHENGLSHMDLYSWHIFMKQFNNTWRCQPIDLERTVIKGNFPWSQWFVRLKQIRDLAVLHLTVPWPEVKDSVRLRFFLRYRKHQKLTKTDKKIIYRILRVARRLGKKRSKFRLYGVAERLASILTLYA